MKTKEDFELLPEIKTMLEENSDIKFEDGGYIYYGKEQLTALAVCYINGAWMAWQAKAQATPDGLVAVNKKELAKVLNCVTDDWLIDTDSLEEFKKIESLIQDEIEAIIEAQEPDND